MLSKVSQSPLTDFTLPKSFSVQWFSKGRGIAGAIAALGERPRPPRVGQVNRQLALPVMVPENAEAHYSS